MQNSTQEPTTVQWHKLLDLAGHGRIFIQTHDYPDPDAIASAFGLSTFLSYFGISSFLCYIGDAERVSVKKAISLLKIPIFEYTKEYNINSSDKIILVDGQKLNDNMTDLPGTEIACIDHHPIKQQPACPYTDLRNVGACSSIITDYFLQAKVPLPKEVATMLLFGLHVDTNYMTRGVTDLDLQIFPHLYRLADKNTLELIEKSNLELSDLKAFGVAINTITIYGRAGFAYIPFTCPDALIAQVADFMLSLAEVDIAIIFSSRVDGLKFSVRCVLPNVHSGNMLASVMPPLGSGGGHASMAGGFVSRRTMQEQGVSEDQAFSILKKRFLAYIEEHTKASH